MILLVHGEPLGRERVKMWRGKRASNGVCFRGYNPVKRSMDCPIHQQIEIYVYDTKCLLDIKDKQPYPKRAMVNKVHPHRTF